MIYDITKELFTAPVYPGDRAPTCEPFKSISAGDACNLTLIHLGTHAGTHMDAPCHFVADGKPIDEVPLEKVIGPCRVASVPETADAGDLDAFLKPGARVLLRGCAGITPAAARLAAARGVWLIGLEGQSIGDREVHCTVLGAEIAVLEGLALSAVPEGSYRLFAQPLKLGGLDGAPVRAVLLDDAEN